jgi:beta-N-acetylhexosaminidase
MPFRDWTPEEKAGAHIMAGFPGTAPPPSLLERIRKGRVGGIILFTRNIESSEQTLELTHSLQLAASSSLHPAPLLISIDQEGGRVSRVSEDFTRFPAAGLFGRIGDTSLAGKAARATGAELRAAGVNMDFAPVIDLLTNPECAVIGDRAYGDEPELVSGMGAAVIGGLQSEGVAASAKHFPGIGEMAPDPHETLPFCDLSLETLRERELAPFRAALNPNLPGGGVASVLVAHAVYTQIDPDRPASISPRIVGGLLREELGYDGLVVTDDLEMGAVEDSAEASLASLLAGSDIALICHSEEKQERALELIAEAIRSGEIEADAEDKSLARIGAAKARYGEPGEEYRKEGLLLRLMKTMKSIVGCEAHRALAEEATRRGEASP